MVTFDFGGVVQPLRDRQLTEWLSRQLRTEFSEFQEYFDSSILKVQEGLKTEADFLNEYDHTLGTVGRTTAAEWFTEPLRSTADTYPEVTALLDRLVGSGVTLAVLSNTVPSHAEYNRGRDLYRWFGKRVYLSHELGAAKPSPEALLAPCRDMGVPPAAILLIDDGPENIRAARDLGMHGILHDSAISSADSLASALEAQGIKF